MRFNSASVAIAIQGDLAMITTMKSSELKVDQEPVQRNASMAAMNAIAKTVTVMIADHFAERIITALDAESNRVE